MADKITEDELYNRIIQRKPELASFDRGEVLNRVYQRKPELRDSIIAAPIKIEEQPLVMPGLPGEPPREMGMTYRQAGEIGAGLLPAAGMVAGGALATPFTAGLSLPMAIAGGAAATGLGAGTGELARQQVMGEGMDIGKAGIEAGIAGTGEGAIRGIFAGGKVLFNAIKENPFIRKGISKFLANSTAGKESWANIAKAIDRGVGKDIPGYEKKVSQIMEGTKKAAVSEMPLVEKDAVGSLSNLQNQLKNLRELSGKKIAIVDDRLAKLASAKGKTIDTTDIGQDLYSFTQDLRQAGMADIPQAKTIIETIEKEIVSIANNPTISVKDAITKKKVINKLFSEFKTNYMDVAQNPIVNEKMMMVAKRLSDKVGKAASDLGYKEYATAYNNFGEYARHYDLELMPLLGSERGQVATLKKFQGIANGLNTQSLKNDLLEATITKLPKGLSKNTLNPVIGNINKVTDQGVLYNLYRDIAASPSSEIVAKWRMLVGPATKKYVQFATDIKPVTTSPSIINPLARGLMSGDEQQ